MRRSIPIVVLTLLCLPVAGVQAEDEAVTPEEAFEAALAKILPPSAETAFTFDGEAIMNGKPFGTVTFKAEPTEDGQAWRVTDTFSAGGGAFVRTSTARLDRRLQPSSGKVTGKEQGTDSFEIEWTRTETGFTAKHTATKAGEAATSEETFEHTGLVTTTLCSLWLFVRASGVAEGSYAVTVFDADPGPGDSTLGTATWTQGAEGAWGDRKALLLTGAKGGNRMEAGFDPQTGALLGVRTETQAKGFDLEIRRVVVAPAKPEKDLFSRPARSAKEAALQAGLAFAVADLELTERVIHWPSLHAKAEAGYAGAEPFPSVAEFKATTMAQLKQNLTERPRAMIEGVLKMVKDQLQTEPVEDGFTQVTFPPMFKSMVLTVGEIDGQWYLVRLPGAPK